MERSTQFIKYLTILCLAFFGLLFMTGCTGSELRHVESELSVVQGKVAAVAEAVGKETYGPDETLNLLKALQVGNVASSPFNPYAAPIGAGLAGIIAMLEALRRKEKGSRKYAEHELRNGSNGKPPGKK